MSIQATTILLALPLTSSSSMFNIIQMSQELPTVPFRIFYLEFCLEPNKRLNWRNVDHADINQIVNVKFKLGRPQTSK